MLSTKARGRLIFHSGFKTNIQMVGAHVNAHQFLFKVSLFIAMYNIGFKSFLL